MRKKAQGVELTDYEWMTIWDHDDHPTRTRPLADAAKSSRLHANAGAKEIAQIKLGQNSEYMKLALDDGNRLGLFDVTILCDEADTNLPRWAVGAWAREARRALADLRLYCFLSSWSGMQLPKWAERARDLRDLRERKHTAAKRLFQRIQDYRQYEAVQEIDGHRKEQSELHRRMEALRKELVALDRRLSSGTAKLEEREKLAGRRDKLVGDISLVKAQIDERPRFPGRGMYEAASKHLFGHSQKAATLKSTCDRVKKTMNKQPGVYYIPVSLDPFAVPHKGKSDGVEFRRR